MVTVYALRVDFREGGFKDKFLSWLTTVALAWIVVYEAESLENRHVHLILDSEKDIKQLRNSFTKKFPECAGNKGYSLKVCRDDYDAYIRYICKGSSPNEPPVVWSRQGLDYTDENIASAHAKYWVTHAALKENSKKRARVEKENIVEQVEREAKKLGLKEYQRDDVARVYIRLFRDARKGINVFAARAVVNTVCCLLEGGDKSETTLAQEIARL